ncbi:uncharacterized protein C8Q71DRAFT_752056 [Rhodofomes roseus]|uniref:DUF6533 domain-containing protein n=1 Tax=Rhodofomes roseus TaxID=34475 RepID=A0ABQ8KKC9_9APHY|nr:uncharacterized protein C8Q71DRAFT_752056 [Rhodofomes roseus]KAH9838607.1 hypothetical protein C8Q71DRAFT_752056 [Rhodofomes roseus]
MSMLYEPVQALSWDTYFVQNCCTAATFSIYLYERAITFSREVDVVWRGPQRRFGYLYAGMHVSAILYFSTNISSWAGMDCTRDRFIYPLYAACWCALSALTGVITAMRVYGVNLSQRRRWLLPAIILTLFLLGPIYAVVFVIYTSYQSSPYPIVCSIGEKRFAFTMQFEAIVRVCNIVADVLVLFVTWRATYANFNEARRLKTPLLLTQQLLKDGTVHFLVLLALNTVVLASWVANNLECSMFVDMFTVVLLSRFVIGLREATYPNTCASTPSQMSDVRFFDRGQDGAPEMEDGASDSSRYDDEG